MSPQFHRMLGTGLLTLVSLVCVACASAPETDSTAVSPSPTATTTPAAPSSSPAAAPPVTAQPLKSSPDNSAQDNEPAVQVENCVVTQAIAADPNPPLNIRSGPEVQSDNVVGTLKNGAWVSVVAEKDGWFQIRSTDGNEVTGWVAKNRTESNCNQKTARIALPQAGGTVAIADRFVGTGSHKYVLRANQGQTLTVTNQKDVFPNILTPTGQPLISGNYDENRQNWTGELPATGEYTLELDSNFKGYDYAFSAQVK
ncbi:SH3 domain-containing protein [Trichocoleus desertorum]|uniref:SH3 domain-containing protein n=2 Tax=Trichocoleus TaxID=450526 RepID=A0ABV0J859_9CYAN|nr:SH3 domain-containing protein [Trichocoleus sp. FACHB-46]